MKYRGCFGGHFVLVKWVPLMVLRTRISLPRNDLRHVRRPGGEGREAHSPTTLRGRSWVPCVTQIGHPATSCFVRRRTILRQIPPAGQDWSGSASRTYLELGRCARTGPIDPISSRRYILADS